LGFVTPLVSVEKQPDKMIVNPTKTAAMVISVMFDNRFISTSFGHLGENVYHIHRIF